MTSRAAFALVCAAALAAAGCGSDRASRGEGSIDVVATTATLADLAQNAGGLRVRARAIIPRSVDPHHWQADAQTRIAVEEADLVLKVGGELDAWLDSVLESAPDTRVLALQPKLQPLGDDSHWWHDPVRVQQAVKEIRNEFAHLDVDGAGYYEAATAAYLARLRRLDSETEACIEAVRGAGERVVTQHAAFRYFNDRYGVELVGPAEGRGAKVGRRLWADTLAPSGSFADSYIGAFAANVGAVVDAISGGERSCRPQR